MTENEKWESETASQTDNWKCHIAMHIKRWLIGIQSCGNYGHGKRLAQTND